MTIGPFTHKYAFLSNFYECKVRFEGVVYKSVEHAYQAAKLEEPAMRAWVGRSFHAAQAKANAKTLQSQWRKDWLEVRVPIMEVLLRSKFSDPKLRERLIKTGDEEIVEINSHHDQFWGVHNRQGQNQLGKLLMQLREEFRNENPVSDRAASDPRSSEA